MRGPLPWWMAKPRRSLTYLGLPGTSGNYASAPDNAALDITGDLDLRIDCMANDWTPASLAGLMGKYGTAGNRSYRFSVTTSGTLQFVWSANGTAVTTVTSTVAPTLTNGERVQLRVAFDVNNGASGNTATFYTRATGLLRSHTGWTQLGDPVVTASTTSIFSGNATLLIGSFTDGTVNLLDGRVYAAAVYSGIAGTEKFYVDFTKGPAYATSLVDEASGLTVTINQSGAPKAELLVA